MTEKNKPKDLKKSKTVPKRQNIGTNVTPMTKPQVEHEYKLSLMRECQIYGKQYAECKEYFRSKGFSLGTTQFKLLRAELKNTKSAKEWFSKEALYVIEEDHMISVERIRKYEEKLVNISHKLIKEDDFETNVEYSTDKSGIVKLRVRNYNTELFLKIISEFKSIQEVKTKMFSATPLVQEMMEVHARQEEDSQILSKPAIQPKIEKEKDIETK